MENTYETAIAEENNMRASMYQVGFEQHPMNTDPHYDLIKLTPEWFALDHKRAEDPNLLFTGKTLTKQSFDQATAFFAEWNWLFEVPGVFLAGGAVFSGIYDKPVNDIDLFIYGCSVDEAKAKLDTIYQTILNHYNFTKKNNYIGVTVARTANAISITKNGRHGDNDEYQIILRLYRSPSEILHGFDVDSCALGYDGKDLWMTPRCEFALRVGYNTVNFSRLSPSYEKRLVKYGTRGVAVKIPNFDRTKVDDEAITDLHYNFVKDATTNPGVRYREIYSHKGIDLLLYLDYHTTFYSHIEKVAGCIAKFADEASDYLPVVFKNRYRTNAMVEQIFEYLEQSADRYPEASAQYFPLLDKFKRDAKETPATAKFYYGLQLSSIPAARTMEYIQYTNTPGRKPDPMSLIHLCYLPDSLYQAFAVVAKWNIPQNVTFKVTNPGEQMTNTFHSIVLADNTQWYQGEFYKM